MNRKTYKLNYRTKLIFNIVVVLSLVCAFFSKVANEVYLNEKICFSIMLFWEICALVKFIMSNSSHDYVLRKLVLINNDVRIIIYIYTLILIVIGIADQSIFSLNIQTFINGFSAISIYYLLGEKSFKYSVISVFAAHFISLFVGVTHIGSFSISGLFKIFELHDIAFGIGYIIIYLLCIKEKWQIKGLKYEIISILIFVLAFKRIGILGLLIALIYWKIVNKLDSKLQSKINLVCGIFLVLFSYLYVFLILSEKIWDILAVYDINYMGRSYYYAVLEQYCNFSMKFVGLGRNAVATIFAKDYSYFSVGNVHSDILRMYAECGFWLFGVWLYNYLIRLPRLFKNKVSSKAQTFVLVCTIYTFIVYLTDNTELYLINNYFYMLVIIHYYKQCKNRMGDKYDEK